MIGIGRIDWNGETCQNERVGWGGGDCLSSLNCKGTLLEAGGPSGAQAVAHRGASGVIQGCTDQGVIIVGPGLELGEGGKCGG